MKQRKQKYFKIFLKKSTIQKNINIITKVIPYLFLFEIICNKEFIYAIQYDNDIIYSEWNKNIWFEIQGLDLDIVYENIVRQVGNIVDYRTELKQEIEKQKYVAELEKDTKAPSSDGVYIVLDIDAISEILNYLENTIKSKKRSQI